MTEPEDVLFDGLKGPFRWLAQLPEGVLGAAIIVLLLVYKVWGIFVKVQSQEVGERYDERWMGGRVMGRGARKSSYEDGNNRMFKQPQQLNQDPCRGSAVD